MVLLKRRRTDKGQKLVYDDQRLIMKAMILGLPRPSSAPLVTGYKGKSIVYHRSTKLAMDTIIEVCDFLPFFGHTVDSIW